MLDVDAMIDAIVARAAETAILVDYDGSLAPIVDLPAAARPLPAAIDALRELSSHVARVGVVSGRPVGFLASHVPVRGATLVGLYGMEVLVDGERRVDPRVAPFLDAVAAVADELDARFDPPIVERKSGVSVTLHWRTVPALEQEVLEVAAELARRHGLGTYQSRYAVELRPPIAIDKGTAIDALVDGFAIAVFAGDDTGDLAGFSALARAQQDARLDRAFRIGVQSDEMPPELPAAVDLLVDGPVGLAALLGAIVTRFTDAG